MYRTHVKSCYYAKRDAANYYGYREWNQQRYEAWQSFEKSLNITKKQRWYLLHIDHGKVRITKKVIDILYSYGLNEGQVKFIIKRQGIDELKYKQIMFKSKAILRKKEN